LEKARKLVHKFSNRKIEPLFLSNEHVVGFCDYFPIEFLGMKEQYNCLYGVDVLKDLKIDQKNLRFQCEQELKSKWILINQQYLSGNMTDRNSLTNLLIRNFTSVVHILKNVLRSRAKIPSDAMEVVLKQISDEFSIDNVNLLKIWEVKKSSLNLKMDDLKGLLVKFVRDLEIIIMKMEQY
jgi:hypothetical protein